MGPDTGGVKQVLLVVGDVLFCLGTLLWFPLALFLNYIWGFGGDAAPTLGAHAFLAVATLFVPALAIVGFATATGFVRFVKAVTLLALGAGGFALACVVAIALYPRYPQQGPHELIAGALVLPAVVLPLGSMLAWRRLGIPRDAVLYCAAWAMVLLVGTTWTFGRDLDLELPLSADVTRWEQNDIQDYSNYFLRADGVSAARAASYAEANRLKKTHGALTCGPSSPQWAPPEAAARWERDDREPEQDLDRYPTGLAGCVTRMAWSADSLYVCDECDWGI